MRVAEFDREKVLCAAMNAFVDKGYNKTSMQDLKQATGLHPGSIYCAFGNKRGLLLAALEHYAQESRQKFENCFDAQPTIREGFRCYFELLLLSCEHQSDCLMQKALSDMHRQDNEMESHICQLLSDWQALITEKIISGQQCGEISSDQTAKMLSQYLVMSIFGLRSYSHLSSEPDVLRGLVDRVLSVLE
ncbi:HTH-type transcriptional repressor ComR [Vibrio aerogenes CECT 7868]|uniref:HTH-type transcriptional repressor ComR n=1 Tax=Vibrio aerogenes CECT 7868 TaxID=1216006 RepID=A0A1M5VFP1_9VIBR|nr:TetR/AcrR family transcriptional regulator [Vibrio aerogenes]SHH74067.1 HTH-type transcriptional repressor ComR [Vibrio aerogenes CECT 7868]